MLFFTLLLLSQSGQKKEFQKMMSLLPTVSLPYKAYSDEQIIAQCKTPFEYGEMKLCGRLFETDKYFVVIGLVPRLDSIEIADVTRQLKDLTIPDFDSLFIPAIVSFSKKGKEIQSLKLFLTPDGYTVYPPLGKMRASYFDRSLTITDSMEIILTDSIKSIEVEDFESYETITGTDSLEVVFNTRYTILKSGKFVDRDLQALP